MIDTVLLDAGGVLVHPDWARIAKILAIEADPAVLARAELVAIRTMDEAAVIHGRPDAARWEQFMRSVLAAGGVHEVADAALATLKAVNAVENLWQHVPDEVLPALAALRALGLRLVVVSNANGTVRATLDRLGIGAFLDGVVDSGEEGVEKPDPRIFLTALARHRVDASRAVHVGDLFHVDVVGARAAGIRAILLDKGGLHADRDCERVATLAEVVELVRRG